MGRKIADARLSPHPGALLLLRPHACALGYILTLLTEL